ncbi:MAG: dTDP-4-dehydrorhamnose reductase [Kiritimatiellaceae bacterium]|nr:dTDP-4-dehydrorhamnose reductase [Kiritimatiellaceae bacterium]
MVSNVLVIGCNGQLGADCMSVFGARAIGIDLPEIDITDRGQCFGKLDAIRPSAIVNCAAYTAVDACETDPACWKVNATGPKHLAEWAAKNGAYLVHISTDYVFSGGNPLFESSVETDIPAPVSEYGKSKLAGEQAVLESGADAAILRTAWLYGAHGKNFLKTMLRLALQNPDREIRVVNDQFGSPTWSYTLARQIAAVVKVRATGIFHATSEGYCSWFDLASRFLQRMAVPHRIAPCTTADYPTPARRPANSILENAALKQRGLNLFETWDVELERFVGEHRILLMNETKGLLK